MTAAESDLPRDEGPVTVSTMPPVTVPVATKRTWLVETALVMGVSLGESAIYSILSIIEKTTRHVALNQQTTSINSSVTPDRPWLDLAYQLAGVGFGVLPALLALYLLRRTGDEASIGFDLTQPWRDLGRGFALCVAIGVPGLGVYLAARALGLNTIVQPANLSAAWWTIPVLILLAVMNGVLEEVVMLGYLFNRWARAGWAPWVIVVVSALIRGSYHLYQGFGGFLGNIAMGLIFGWLYLRFKRVMPLVVAHVIIDIFAFVGYSLLAPLLPWLT